MDKQKYFMAFLCQINDIDPSDPKAGEQLDKILKTKDKTYMQAALDKFNNEVWPKIQNNQVESAKKGAYIKKLKFGTKKMQQGGTVNTQSFGPRRYGAINSQSFGPRQYGKVNNPHESKSTSIFDYIKKVFNALQGPPSQVEAREARAKEAEKNNFGVKPNAYTGNIPAWITTNEQLNVKPAYSNADTIYNVPEVLVVANKKTPARNQEGIYDYMTKNGMNGSFRNRESLYNQYFTDKFTGTAAQNMALMNILKKRDQWNPNEYYTNLERKQIASTPLKAPITVLKVPEVQIIKPETLAYHPIGVNGTLA